MHVYYFLNNHWFFFRLIVEAEKLLKSDISINKKIGEYGGKDILRKCQTPVSILTHCNTGSLATAGYGTALGKNKKLLIMHEK